MNILLITPEHFVEGRLGGVSRYTVNLAQYLGKNNNVSVLIPGENKSWKKNRYTIYARSHTDLVSESYPVKKILAKLKSFFANRLPDFYWRFKWSYIVYLFVKEKGPFDIIESPEWNNGIFFVKLLDRKQKVVTKLHRSWFLYKTDNLLPHTIEDHLINMFEMFTTLLSDAISSPNKFMFSRYRSWLRFYTHQKVIIKYGISLPKIGVKHTTEQKYLLFVGRIEVAKGCFNLIQAFHDIHGDFPDLKLYLAGEDTEMIIDSKRTSYLSYLKNYLKRKGLSNHVVFLGKLNEKKLQFYYQHAEFIIVPSQGNENQPLVVLESLSYNKAIVASKTGGIPEILKHNKNGLLFKPEDRNDLANNMLKLLSDSTFKRTIEVGASKLKKRYDVALNGKMTLNLYRSLIKTK